MRYKNIKNICQPISQIVQGTIMLETAKQEECNALLDGVKALGVNCFDTAWGYGAGESERALGRWIADRGNREEIIILTKCAHPTIDRMRSKPCDIYSQFEDSLARLHTDYIDIYMLHRDDTSNPVGPVVEAMNRLVEQGRIRIYGGSNWSAKRIEEANEYAYKYNLQPMQVSSPNFGLGEQIREPWAYNAISLTGDSMKEERTWYKKSKMPIFAYSSLGRGWFSGLISRKNFAESKHLVDQYCLKAYEDERNFKRLDRCEELAQKYDASVPQIAMAYVLDQPEMNLFALLGARKTEEMHEAIKAFDIHLSQEELEYLNLER